MLVLVITEETSNQSVVLYFNVILVAAEDTGLQASEILEILARDNAVGEG